MNIFIGTGNAGGDPEMRYTPNGSAVTHFSMAVNEAYTNSAGEKIENTVWFRIVTWNRLAENVNNYVVKGSKVGVQGKIKLVKYTGQDGIERSYMEVNAFTVEFLGRPANGGGGYGNGNNDNNGGYGNGGAQPDTAAEYDGDGDEPDADDLPW